MFGKQEVIDFLNEKQIAFEKVEHDAVFTIEDMEGLGLDEKERSARTCSFGTKRARSIFWWCYPMVRKWIWLPYQTHWERASSASHRQTV